MGGFELAAAIDYLFAYDAAPAGCGTGVYGSHLRSNGCSQEDTLKSYARPIPGHCATWANGCLSPQPGLLAGKPASTNCEHLRQVGAFSSLKAWLKT